MRVFKFLLFVWFVLFVVIVCNISGCSRADLPTPVEPPDPEPLVVEFSVNKTLSRDNRIVRVPVVVPPGEWRVFGVFGYSGDAQCNENLVLQESELLGNDRVVLLDDNDLLGFHFRPLSNKIIIDVEVSAVMTFSHPGPFPRGGQESVKIARIIYNRIIQGD